MIKLTNDEIKEYCFNILKFVKNFCEENNINYFLDFGTLLGAVRHKGFIPWDEDIDLGMTRADYDKFIKTFDDPSGRYKLLSFPETPNYMNTFVKVIDTKTVVHEDVKYNPEEYGLWVDIFPYDNWNVKDKLTYGRLRFHNAIYMVKMFDIDSKLTLKNLVKRIFKACVCLVSFKRATAKYISLGKKYKDKEMDHLICSAAVVDTSAIVEAKWYKEKIELEFCGEKFKCPKMYDEVLNHLYGSTYMELPKVEDRYNHNIDVWLKD